MDTCVLREFKNSSLPLCCQISFIRIPDFNNQELNNLGKPIIVFPILEKARTMPQDDVFGYFMNGGVLDSVTMSAFADMDNEDDFYQWFVGRIPNCNADWKDPGCDNDGICEPQFGETELNCEDCQNLAKTGPGVGRLYLWSITSLEDKRGRNVSAPNPEKRFQEWHYNGKYEIGFQYAIHNTQTQKIDYQFVIDDANVDTPYRHDADILKEFSSWGNPCQVKRSKKKLNGSWVSNNGVSTTETFGQGGLKPNGQSTIMSNNFLPMIDEVYFVLYEKALKNISLYRDNVAGRYGSFGMSVVNFDYLSDSISKHAHRLKLGMLGNTLSSKGAILKDKWYYNVNARTSYTFFSNEIPADFWDFSFASTYHINERNKLEIITQLSNDNMLLAEIYNTAITFSKSSNFVQLAWQKWNAPKNRKIENKVGFSQYTKIGTALTFDESYEDESLLAINANGQEWYSYHFSVEQPLYNGIRIDYGVQAMLGRNVERDHQYQFEGINYSKPFVYGQFPKSVLNQAINIVPYIDLRLDSNNWSYHLALRPNLYTNLTTRYSTIPLEATLGVSKAVKLNIYSFSLDRRAQINHNINPYFIANDLERWSFANAAIKPQLVNQVAISVLHKRTKIAWTNSIYAKNITNVYVYRDGANIFLSDFTSEVLPTKGYAYGFETGLVYNTPVQTISLNYTYSKSFLKTPDVNRNMAFPADFDRPHSLKYFHSLRIREHTTFSLNGILVSGRPLTVLEYADGPFYIFSDRNEYRLPLYKRIDLSFNHNRTFFKGKMLTEISYGAYNVANFRNPFFVVYGGSGVDKDGNYITKYDFINLMPFIPYISLEVSF